LQIDACQPGHGELYTVRIIVATEGVYMMAESHFHVGNLSHSL
jgi:hypothetical protein